MTRDDTARAMGRWVDDCRVRSEGGDTGRVAGYLFAVHLWVSYQVGRLDRPRRAESILLERKDVD